jgi:hypothetical protein
MQPHLPAEHRLQQREVLMILRAALASVIFASAAAAQDRKPITENVLFVTFDGLRWEEVFSGAEESLISKERGGVANVPVIKERFWREDPKARREALLPFLWGEVAKKGQIFGNAKAGCPIRVTNGMYFSYPGYNEILAGFADDKIDSNDRNFNKNVTVLEWLHGKPAFKGKVAATTSWEVQYWIINSPRSGIPVSAGARPLEGFPKTPEFDLLSRLAVEAPLFGDTDRSDALTFETAKAVLKSMKPRVLFVGFDETDNQGHAGRYDRVLASANKNDRFVGELWKLMQSMPEYAGKTSLVVTTDHGRGPPPVEWKNHGAKVQGAEYVWAGVLGPDTPSLGERRDVKGLTQGSSAATVAALLGEDYNAAQPKAAKPYPGVVGVRK